MSNNQQIQWPNDLKSFRYQITFDFVTSLSHRMKLKNITQKKLAQKLGVTEGRISQVINNPGNFTLQSMVEWAHAVEMKPSVILYDDKDPNYQKPPVYADAFVQLWDIHGKPHNFGDIQAIRDLCSQCERRINLSLDMQDLEQTVKHKARSVKIEKERNISGEKWKINPHDGKDDYSQAA